MRPAAVSSSKFISSVTSARSSGSHLGEDFLRRIGRHVAQQVGSGVGIHLLHDVGGAVGIERAENRDLHLGIDLLQGFGGDLFVEGLEDGFALGWGQVLDNVGDVGGMQLGQAIERDLQLDAAGGINLDEVNKFPRNHPRRNLRQQRTAARRREPLPSAGGGWPRARPHPPRPA